MTDMGGVASPLLANIYMNRFLIPGRKPVPRQVESVPTGLVELIPLRNAPVRNPRC